MVDFFGNSSETHVKLDKKAIGTTKDKSSFQELGIGFMELTDIRYNWRIRSIHAGIDPRVASKSLGNGWVTRCICLLYTSDAADES